MQVGVYVDGFNLYHAIAALGQPQLKWLSINALAKSFLKGEDVLVRICYFTAIQHAFPAKAQRHRRYISALQATGVQVHEARFQKTSKHCAHRGGGCNFHEEKQTDVRFSSEVLMDAFAGTVDRFVLVTADSDQVPTAQVLKRLNPACAVTVAAPPGRLLVARELRSWSDDHLEISAGRLRAALLPRNIYDPHGKFVAACPTEYI
jgi:uncharacterized LabA/DUF88 family protein